MSKITRGLAIAADRKLSTGGAAAWSVEAADEQVRRLRKHGANACNRLLALLRAHHDYGAGELMLKGGRRTPATNRRPAASGPPAPSAPAFIVLTRPRRSDHIVAVEQMLGAD